MAPFRPSGILLTLAVAASSAGVRASPAGQLATRSGIVTALTPHGFFLQAPDDEADDDPATSEGIFVATGRAPAAAVAVGNMVRVTGTLVELAASPGRGRPPVVEITGPVAVTLVSTGNDLPAPVALTPGDLDSAPDGLARWEGMRVRLDGLRVVAPTQGVVNERSAVASSTGVFFGVLPGPARPRRLRVDSDGQIGAAALEVTTGSTVTDLVGVLHLAAEGYTLMPDAGGALAIGDNRAAGPVPAPARDEFTVAFFDMDRFFDATSDPDRTAPVLTAAAFERRLGKVSLAIRHVMRSPDVVGVDGVENLAALWAVAERINGDAVAAREPDPVYMAFLAEGNDATGLDVGFLVRASRVVAFDVTQEGGAATYDDPVEHIPATLFDRPPLVLRALVAAPRGPAAPVTAIVGGLRSLSVRGTAGAPGGRARRRAQEEFLADLVRARRADDPGERIVVLGDLERLSGFADLAGTVPAAERYSVATDGRFRLLHRILVNGRLQGHVRRLRFARNGADFPESFRNDATRPERVSRHDAPVAYLRFNRADLALTKVVTPGRVAAGASLTYTLLVTNEGPDDAMQVEVADTLPAPASFEAVAVPAGWSCSTPEVAATGTVTCAAAALPARESATFMIAARVSCAWPAGDVLPSTAIAAAATADPDRANDVAIAASRVSAACANRP